MKGGSPKTFAESDSPQCFVKGGSPKGFVKEGSPMVLQKGVLPWVLSKWVPPRFALHLKVSVENIFKVCLANLLENYLLDPLKLFSGIIWKGFTFGWSAFDV